MIENMKKLKRLIGYILNILIVIVVSITLIGMYYMAQITFLKKDYVNICGYTFFEVATGSMASTINVGDIVVVRITNEINENINGSTCFATMQHFDIGQLASMGLHWCLSQR